jgi:hypothetical protein
MGVMWNLVLVHLKIVLILTQDRCMVCTEGTVGLDIVLGYLEMVLVESYFGLFRYCLHQIELLRDVVHVESHFGLFGDGPSGRAR